MYPRRYAATVLDPAHKIEGFTQARARPSLTAEHGAFDAIDLRRSPAAVKGEKMTSSTTLLRPKEVAALFSVDSRTVTRWAAAGRLKSVRTLGGHHRYPADAVHELLATQEPSRNGAEHTP